MPHRPPAQRYEGCCTCRARCRCNLAGACALQRVKIAGESADKVHHCISACQCADQALWVGHIAAGKLQLAEIAQRSQVKGALRVAAGDPQSGPARQQLLHQMRAKKAASAQQHDQSVVQFPVVACACHCLNPALNDGSDRMTLAQVPCHSGPRARNR